MFFFLSLTKSIFVPPSVTSQSHIKRLTLEEGMKSSIDTGKTHFGFYIDEEGSQSKEITTKVVQASILHDDVNFFYTDRESISNYSDYQEYSSHLFFVINNGKIDTVIPIQNDEESVFTMFDYFSTTKHHLFETKEDLFEYIGKTSFAILTTSDKFEIAKDLQNQSAVSMGYVEVLITTKQVIAEVTENATADFGFYRREDGFIVTLNPTLEDVYYASYPIYRNLRKDDFTDEDNFIFALSSPEFTDEMEDFLLAIGSEYPQFIIGFATPSVFIHASNFVSEQNNFYNVALFNGVSLSYFNICNYFTPELLNAHPFNKDEFLIATANLLDDVMNEKIKPAHISEDEPEYDDNMQVVVGKTYSNFITNSSQDNLILYMKETCKHCRRFMPVYMDLAAELKQANLNIRFGYIDISKNSSPEPFPEMRGVPHLVMFRNGGQKRIPFYCPLTRNEILRYLKNVCNITLDIQTEEPDTFALSQHLLELMMSYEEGVAKEDQEVFATYIQNEHEILKEEIKDGAKPTGSEEL